MFKNQREKFLFSLTLAALLILGGNYGYLKINEQFGLLRDEIDDKQMRLDNWENLKAERQVKEKLYEKILEEVHLTGDSKLAVGEQITRLMKNAGIQPKRLEFQNISRSKDDVFESINYALSDIECTWEQLLRFLYLLDNDSAVLEVSELRVRPADDKEYRFPIRASMKISRLVSVEPEEEPRARRRRRS